MLHNSHTPDTKYLHNPGTTTYKGAQAENGCKFSNGAHSRGSGADSKGGDIRSKGEDIPNPEVRHAWSHWQAYTFTSIPTTHLACCTTHVLTYSKYRFPWEGLRPTAPTPIYSHMSNECNWWRNMTVPWIHTTVETSQVPIDLEYIILQQTGPIVPRGWQRHWCTTRTTRQGYIHI